MNPQNTIGLGTAAIGRPQYINIRQEEQVALDLTAFKQKGKEVLDKAYAAGIRYFDTAPGYGMAEQLLLEWVQQKQDPAIEVATKWGYTYTANFDPHATQHEVKEHSLSKLNEQWEVSRQLLPALSVYQIHSATFQTGVLDNAEIGKRLHELKEQHGLIIGITTTGDNQVEVIERALDVAVEGQPLFGAFQVTYNVLEQSLSEMAGKLVASGKRIIVKEAMANGRIFPNTDYAHYMPVYQVLQQLAAKYGVGIDAIALRFCMDSIEPFKVLSGAATPLHLAQNLKAYDFELSEQDVQLLQSCRVSPEAYWAERKKLGWN